MKVVLSNTQVSQGNAATVSRVGGMFNSNFRRSSVVNSTVRKITKIRLHLSKSSQ